MTHNFPYLKDSQFLKKFDQTKLKEQYIKLIILTFDENPIQQIQGKVISGNISFDGSSAMRRTCNLNMIAGEYENDLTDTKHLLSINKKVEVLIGFVNTTDEYQQYQMLWFPQGTYVIIAPSISHSSGGINISLTLHDKMALLNGECGGTLPASVVFHEVQDIDENGNIEIKKPTIYQIIQEVVNHFGGEQLGKIIISDVDSRIKQVMKWTGAAPIYLYREVQQDKIYNSFNTDYNKAKKEQDQSGRVGNITTFSYGMDIGYIMTDFTYPGQLIGNAGETVVSILDKIKNVLGNYEYFYDVNGNFIFQEIKNYLNTSYSTFLINEINENNYLADYSGGKSVYTFQDANIIQSYSNTPQYQQIKNDFLVWGKRTSIDGQEIPIRYHLAIDTKPIVGNKYKVFFFTDPDDGVVKAKKALEFEYQSMFPKIGEFGQYYYANDTGLIYKWNLQILTYEATTYSIEQITTTDYRTQLYMAGVISEPFGLDSNYYYTELKNEWPKIYDIKNEKFFDQAINHSSDIDFFLDFIDTNTEISEFSVKNIGRRTSIISDNTINCIFEPNIPNLIIIESGTNETNNLVKECDNKKQQYVLVRSQIFNMLNTGGSFKSAYEEIRKELYQYTNYNEQISLAALPIYYLEPNVRITVRDNESGIYGDYMIKSISMPLDINGTMSLSCTRALERI